MVKGNLLSIREYFREKFHQYAGTKNTNQLLKMATGERLNVDYYINYLKEKYYFQLEDNVIK